MSSPAVPPVERTPPDNAQALDELCAEYAGYLDPSPAVTKDIQATEDMIDSLLARLDEFGTVIDTLSTEHTKVLRVHLPALRTQAAHLVKLFRTIDMLEGVMAAMNKSVYEMEEKVNAADAASSVISVQRFFSLFSSKRAEDADALLHKAIPIVDPSKHFAEIRKALQQSSSSPVPATTTATASSDDAI